MSVESPSSLIYTDSPAPLGSLPAPAPAEAAELAEQPSTAPLPRSISPWLVSLTLHLAFLVAISLITTSAVRNHNVLTLLSREETELVEPDVDRQFAFSAEPFPDPGAGGVDGLEIPLGQGPQLAAVAQLPQTLLPMADVAPLEQPLELLQPASTHLRDDTVVRGVAGHAATGAEGAIDRLTQEILLSLEERDTLVVWLFDQSGSLAAQRDAVVARFDRIYDELGVIRQSGHRALSRGNSPLLSAIFAFGEQVTLLTRQPTADADELKELVRSIPTDDSGIEMAFTAIYKAAERFRSYRSRRGADGQPERNVMLVVFSDEVGDDQAGLEQTLRLCRRWAMPVYVVGVPAPFGMAETHIKWVDPDPQYDQRPQWGRVNQGPESLLPERVLLPLVGTDEIREPLDSGFGPYALTRLAYETGGIYFTVHPNRTVTRPVHRGQVDPYASYLRRFFDPEVMRRYRPDYVAVDEYRRLLQEYPSRRALVEAAQFSQLERLENPQLRFIKRDEAQLAADLTEAQKDAAKLLPQIELVFQTLTQGESHRAKEVSPRWQAGFDLAMGMVSAVKVRTETYNAMLAMAKRGMPFENSQNNTWVLQPADEIVVGSRLEQLAEKSRTYLKRVVDEHAGTPWAYLAERELNQPLGWKWVEAYTNLDPPSPPAATVNAPAAPRDDQPRMIERRPSRPVPRL